MQIIQAKKTLPTKDIEAQILWSAADQRIY